jgi:hypothetical protein
MKHIDEGNCWMSLGHYLSIGKLKLESALSEGAKRDKGLALASRRLAWGLRLSTVPLSVGGQQMGLKYKEVKIQEQERDRALTILSEIGVVS